MHFRNENKIAVVSNFSSSKSFPIQAYWKRSEKGIHHLLYCRKIVTYISDKISKHSWFLEKKFDHFDQAILIISLFQKIGSA